MVKALKEIVKPEGTIIPRNPNYYEFAALSVDVAFGVFFLALSVVDYSFSGKFVFGSILNLIQQHLPLKVVMKIVSKRFQFI